MDTYLSIDLDYWMNTDDEEAIIFFKELIENIKENDLPLRIVSEHQDLLPFINDSHASVLRNMDFHADLQRFDRQSIANDYDFIGHVDWAYEGKYIWHHPCDLSHKFEVSTCAYIPENIPITKHISAFNKDTAGIDFGWKEVSAVKGGVSNLENVVAVGVALSPSYSKRSTVDCVMELIGCYASK